MKTKRDLALEIAQKLDLSQTDTKRVVQWTFDAIIDSLVADGRIELRNFGVFEVIWRKARQGRNPKTGEKVFVPAHNAATFQPGKVMAQRIRAATIAGSGEKPSTEG